MVTDDPVGRTYWTVKNGLRMTGMPGFGEMLSENQLWQVSLLLSQADKLPAGSKRSFDQAAGKCQRANAKQYSSRYSEAGPGASSRPRS